MNPQRPQQSYLWLALPVSPELAGQRQELSLGLAGWQPSSRLSVRNPALIRWGSDRGEHLVTWATTHTHAYSHAHMCTPHTPMKGLGHFKISNVKLGAN